MPLAIQLMFVMAIDGNGLQPQLLRDHTLDHGSQYPWPLNHAIGSCRVLQVLCLKPERLQFGWLIRLVGWGFLVDEGMALFSVDRRDSLRSRPLVPKYF